jgi:PAS domain S-box-containing protein
MREAVGALDSALGGQWREPLLRNKLTEVRRAGDRVIAMLAESDADQDASRLAVVSALSEVRDGILGAEGEMFRVVEGHEASKRRAIVSVVPLMLVVLGVAWTGIFLLDRRVGRLMGALDRAELRYRTLLEMSDDAILMTDMNGRSLYWNRAYMTSLGYETGDNPSTVGWGRVHPDDQSLVSGIVPRVLEEGRVTSQYRVRHRDGHWLEHQSKSELVRDERGEPEAILTTIRDVTEQRELERTEGRYRTLVETASEGIFITDPEGRYIDVNPSGCEMLGYTREEILSLHISDLIPAEDLREKPVPLNELHRGEAMLSERRLIRKDGTLMDAEISGRALPDGNLLGVVRDVTSRRDTERALRESERALSTLMRNLPGMAYRCTCDPGWPVVFASEGSVELTGYEPEALMSGRVSTEAMTHAEDRPRLLEEVDRAIEEHRSFELAYRIRARDGKEKWVWEKGMGVYDESGKPVALEGFIADITERERISMELRMARDRIEALLQAGRWVQEAETERAALEAIAEAVRRSGWESVAAYSFRDWEMVESAFVGLTDKEISWLKTHAETPELRALQYSQPYERFRVSRSYFIPSSLVSELPGAPEIKPSHRAVREGDTWQEKDLAYVPMYGRDGSVIGTIAIDDPEDGQRPTAERFRYLELFADLAARCIEHLRSEQERRRTEMALRESEERYRHLVEGSPIPIAIHCDERIVFANTAAAQTLGASSVSELVGRSVWDIVDPSARENMRAGMEAVFGGQVQVHTGEELYVRLDGTCIDVEVRCTRIEYEGRLAAQVVFHDISDRKHAEEALRENEKWLRTLIDASPDLVCLKDGAGRWRVANEFCLELYGLNGQEYVGLTDDVLAERSSGHGGALLDCQLSDEDAWRGEAPFRRDKRILSQGGDERVLDMAKAPVFGADGERMGLVVVGREITERVRAEAQLREHEERLRLVVDTAMDAVITMDAEGVVTGWNAQACRTFGWSEDEAVGRSVLDLLVPEEFRSDYEFAISASGDEAGGSSRRIETEAKCRDGRRIPVEIAVTPISHGQSLIYSAFVRDISERRAAEERRRQQVYYLESMARLSEVIASNMDVEAMLDGAMRVMLDVFECDRAWLLQPCDPKAKSWSVPVEVTRPEYPGAGGTGEKYPMDEAKRAVIEDSLETEEPVSWGPDRPFRGGRAVADEFGIASQLAVAIKPRVGDPWLVGLHQCSYARVWTEDECRLFRDMSLRITDVLTNVLLYRDLGESEQRYRVLAQQSPEAIVVHQDGHVVYVNDACVKLVRANGPEDLIGREVLEFVHEKDKRTARDRIRRALLEGSTLTALEEVFIREDGTEVDVEVSGAVCVYGGRRAVQVVMRDITERKRAERRQVLMMRELDHRVKNNLAAVLSIAEQSLHVCTSLEDFRESFTGRIRALARVHGLLAGSGWEGASVRELVAMVLEAYAHGDGSRVELAGEDVTLTARATSPVCMALHELATNAVKYGSLSVPSGRVSVAWEVEEEDKQRNLRLSWVESGGPVVAEPRSRGFGAELIEGAVAYELHGRVNVTYDPHGVRCEMVVPLEREAEPLLG